MTPLQMIEEWRKGCSNAGPSIGKPEQSPAECTECTAGLIDALERKLRSPSGPVSETPDHIKQHIAKVADSLARRMGGRYVLNEPTPAADPVGDELDWRAIAKAAGEHGVRYRTNTALLKFLDAVCPAALRPTPPDAGLWEAATEFFAAADALSLYNTDSIAPVPIGMWERYHNANTALRAALATKTTPA